MEMFDEIVRTKIEDGNVTVEREPTEDTLQAEAMQEACGMLLTAERKFRKLSAHRDVVTDSRINCMWWDSLEQVYQADKALRRLFVGSQPTIAQNKLYNEFREMLLKGSSLKAHA